MDVGVGAVMYSSGLIHRRTRESVFKDDKPVNILRDLWGLFKSSFFVFILAFGRYLLHKEVDYHVIISHSLSYRVTSQNGVSTGTSMQQSTW